VPLRTRDHTPIRRNTAAGQGSRCCKLSALSSISGASSSWFASAAMANENVFGGGDFSDRGSNCFFFASGFVGIDISSSVSSAKAFSVSSSFAWPAGRFPGVWVPSALTFRGAIPKEEDHRVGAERRHVPELSRSELTEGLTDILVPGRTTNSSSRLLFGRALLTHRSRFFGN
jgi:hypothetical protein